MEAGWFKAAHRPTRPGRLHPSAILRRWRLRRRLESLNLLSSVVCFSSPLWLGNVSQHTFPVAASEQMAPGRFSSQTAQDERRILTPECDAVGQGILAAEPPRLVRDVIEVAFRIRI